MRKIFSVLILSLIVIGGIIGSASATQYAATIKVFNDAFTLTGQNRTLVLVFGLPSQTTFSLEVNTIDIGDVTFFLNDEEIEVTAETESLGVALLDKSVPLSADSLSQVTFDYITDSESLLISDFQFRDELLVFKRIINTTESEYWTLNIHTPEASTFTLMGLGLLSLIGIRKWKKKRQKI